MNKIIDKDARAFDKFSREIEEDDNLTVQNEKILTEERNLYNNNIINDKMNTINRNLKDNTHLEKHEKYLSLYKSNEVFWGLGIENEFYLECEKRPEISKDIFINNHTRERYSVNYYSNYNKDLKNEAFANTNHVEIDIPVLINSHSFTDTDKNNNHKILENSKVENEKSRSFNEKSRSFNEKIRNTKSHQVKGKLLNPDFLGKTLGEEILESNKELFDTFNKTWLYDGDTFEITTLNFYKTDVQDMIEELEKYKTDFITNIQKYQANSNLFSSFGKIKIMEKNYPFALHMTNLNNIGIFNNGTLHYNLTLPTELDDKMLIVNQEKFNREHKEAIKIIQWFEPLMVSVYGTPDYFSQVVNFSNAQKFSASSQRCAVSRYIGLGTYDTDKMPKGKVLLTELANFSNYFWYHKYHENSAYNKLDKIGLDINFNKHYNHGIEIRFFDHISSPELIMESFEFIIYLMDLVLETSANLDNPIKVKQWNNLVCNIMIHGKKYNMTNEEISYYENMLKIKINSINIYDVYYEIFSKIKSKFTKKFKNGLIPFGKFSRNVLMPKKIVIPYSDIIDENISCYSIYNIVNLSKFTDELEQLLNYPNVPTEIIHISEIVETLVETLDQLEQLNKFDVSTSEKCKNSKILLLKDINRILLSSVDVLNANIEKIFDNKIKIETELYCKIINLIESFKII